MPHSSMRHVKGPNLIGLVKLLRNHRKTRPIAGVSDEGLRLVDEHILPTNWYRFEPFMELIEFTWREILVRREEQALEMGIAGGRAALEGIHKVFVTPGDPRATLLAMRPAWRAYFDFGELQANADGGDAVRFELEGYDDVTAPHAMLIAGWHVAAARVSGAESARVEVVERPWRGGSRLVHRVVY